MTTYNAGKVRACTRGYLQVFQPRTEERHVSIKRQQQSDNVTGGIRDEVAISRCICSFTAVLLSVCYREVQGPLLSCQIFNLGYGRLSFLTDIAWWCIGR